VQNHRLGRRLAAVVLAAAVAVPLAAVASGGSAFGATISVPCNGGNPAALIAAIKAANGTPTADTINVAAGCTYVFNAPDNTTDGGNALPVITTPITINGSGVTLQRSTAGGTLDFRLVEVSSNGTLTLNGETLTNGQLTQGPLSAGAGLLNFGTTNLKNAKVDGNRVLISGSPSVPVGGGIANINPGVLNVSNSDVSGNQLDASTMCLCMSAAIPLGGGIANSGTTTINTSTVTNNTAQGGGGVVFAFGGGISSGAANAPMVTITASKLLDNEVTGSDAFGFAVGGGFAGNALSMSSTEVAGNLTGQLSGYAGEALGGGIAVTKATNISSNSSIHDNDAVGISGSAAAGGGVANLAGLTITSSSIYNNTAGTLSSSAPAFGGGIHNAGTLVLNTTKVSGNQAFGSPGWGGGIFNAQGATAHLVNSSVKSNQASDDGGGVYNDLSNPSTAVSGSVTAITGNTPDNCVHVSGCVG